MGQWSHGFMGAKVGPVPRKSQWNKFSWFFRPREIRKMHKLMSREAETTKIKVLRKKARGVM
jgi:hypothetical protein